MKFHIIILLLLSVMFSGCSAWRGVVSAVQVREDKNGDTPRNAAQKFIKFCESSNYDAAKALWTLESIKKLEMLTSYGDGFKGYCDHFKKNEDHNFSFATRGKGEFFWLRYHGSESSYSFSFRKINDIWMMIF